MPTEEVFSPLTSAVLKVMLPLQKPLSYNGNIIEGIKVDLENGEIVDITAEKAIKS